MAIREPRPIEVNAKFVVRNVKAESFDEAKELAREHVNARTLKSYNLTPYASKEVDGSFTVEYR